MELDETARRGGPPRHGGELEELAGGGAAAALSAGAAEVDAFRKSSGPRGGLALRRRARDFALERKVGCYLADARAGNYDGLPGTRIVTLLGGLVRRGAPGGGDTRSRCAAADVSPRCGHRGGTGPVSRQALFKKVRRKALMWPNCGF